MRMSDLVAQYILDMLEEQNGSAEIKRNELAGDLGCVPSQINYVITRRRRLHQDQPRQDGQRHRRDAHRKFGGR